MSPHAERYAAALPRLPHAARSLPGPARHPPPSSVTSSQPVALRCETARPHPWPRRTGQLLAAGRLPQPRGPVLRRRSATRVPSGENTAERDRVLMAAQDRPAPGRWRRPTAARSCPRDAGQRPARRRARTPPSRDPVLMAAQDQAAPGRWRPPTAARSCPTDAVSTRAPSGENTALMRPRPHGRAGPAAPGRWRPPTAAPVLS